MITQCALRHSGGIIPFDGPPTLSKAQDVCIEAGVDFHIVEPGFVTESGVFMTRVEAGVHALACKQTTRLATPPYLSWSDLS